MSSPLEELDGDAGGRQAAEDYPGEWGALRDHLVLDLDGSWNEHYEVGGFELESISGTSVELLALCVLEDRVLVAVPKEAWDRVRAKRILPAQALSKALLCNVAAMDADERSPVAGEELKVWVGLLAPQFEKQVCYPFVSVPAYSFGGGETGFLLPHPAGLHTLAVEKFQFLSAESGEPQIDAPAPSAGADDRLQRLEEMVFAMQKSFQDFVDAGGDAKAKKVAPAPAASKAKAAPRGRGEKAELDAGDGRKGVLKNAGSKPAQAPTMQHLDNGVVSAALAAGIPASHLQEMDRLVGSKPKRLDDAPRPLARPPTTLSESEEGQDGEEEELDDEEAGDSVGPVEKAVLKLTKIAQTLAGKKSKTDQSIEQVLDAGSAGSSEMSSLGSKRNAAALRALQRQLKDNPGYLWRTLEANMQADFMSVPVAPGEPLKEGVSVRGWLTSRSRVQLYHNHVRWVWQVGAIWDCLIAGRNDEARARAGLLVAAADQSAIDSGSWLIASVGLLEQPPPFHAFSAHQLPGPSDHQFSALSDPRWVDLYLAHVKDLEAVQEAKRKLGKNPKTDKDKDKEDRKEDRAPKPKKKGAGRGNGGANEPSTGS